MSATITVEKRKLEKPPLELHYLGDRVLRQPAKRIAKVDDSIRQLAKEMLQTMYSANGIGLAAPQVAVNKQLIVIDCEPDKPENPPLILINPQIIGYGRELCKAEEGCLSIPDVFLDVIRPQAIEVSYKDEQGKPRKLQANGLLARVIQHEMDHLNGVMFVDRVDNDLALNEELKKHGFSVQAVKPVEKVTK
ncbi:polypeptide deformylase [Microcystis aeruginosa NIES-3806]|jgi:peptide deformylase|uniref:Peptide deformylase n=1 Tax=Microcystis aeruginosa NIES-2549 TaxID=1641812 RepID=A0A0F6RLX9_MICAE|nr:MULTISPECIES: peptide deformylase [Microcystis]AKE65100.1 Peptide deformylase [Microcystis aeruginosa NIES-2549]AOC53505.1 Peptide deformylase [Microcystis aeruginosa NIES-2481]MCA2653038.1 peptide deformylase [Microcystis sp. M061S2]GCL53509.1 polypeptide deformylase [Microcystis aeruginosa NIES-3806]